MPDDSIGVIGSFASLITPTPLGRVEESNYWAVSFAVPKGRAYCYKFVAGGRVMADAINTQHIRLPNGSEWSRFFTEFW